MKNLELKQYVFAAYFGQEVLQLANGIKGRLHPIISCDISTESILNNSCLHLRPLSSITDQEAIEVAKIAMPENAMYVDEIDGKNIISALNTNGYNIKFNLSISIYQYLQQQGFALPIYFKCEHYSVERLVELGIITPNPMNPNLEALITQICGAIDNGVTPHVENFRHLIDKYGDENKRVFHSNMEKKTIQGRAELQIPAIIEDSFPYLEEHSPSVQRRIKQATRNAYIAGATEQQALSEADLHKYKSLYEELDANQEPLQDRCILSEARIKDLEEALKVVLVDYKDKKIKSGAVIQRINKALNNQQ